MCLPNPKPTGLCQPRGVFFSCVHSVAQSHKKVRIHTLQPQQVSWHRDRGDRWPPADGWLRTPALSPGVAQPAAITLHGQGGHCHRVGECQVVPLHTGAQFYVTPLLPKFVCLLFWSEPADVQRPGGCEYKTSVLTATMLLDKLLQDVLPITKKIKIFKSQFLPHLLTCQTRWLYHKGVTPPPLQERLLTHHLCLHWQKQQKIPTSCTLILSIVLPFK